MSSILAESRPGFRPDINGLRAWAVLLVILYHFGIPGFDGGFLGVDVFFVISGFLMTSIIVEGLRTERFSLWQFYLARARRIFPALAILCATLLAVGWFVLPSTDYRTLGTHSVLSLVFLSNIKYWSEAGYFDVASHEKWLLHTWSLSVEWQFYLLLPLALIAAWKFRPGRNSVAFALTAGFVGSLALSIIVSPTQPDAGFYLLPTRAWEMLFGGLIYLLAWKPKTTKQTKVLELLGISLIAGSVIAFDTSSNWPGWRALLPVIGAGLILLAARPKSMWTTNRVAQWMGTCSYSLYLWHWPIVVALAYLQLQYDGGAVMVGLATTLALGQLSYKLVESPARRQLTQLQFRPAVVVLALSGLAVGTPGAAARFSDGFPSRLPEKVELAAQEANNQNLRKQRCYLLKGIESPSCVYGGEHIKAVLIGDSHANAVITALASALPDVNDSVLEWSYIGCPTIRGARRNPEINPDRRCSEFNDWALKELEAIDTSVPLIIVSRTSLYAKGHNEPWEKTANTPQVFFTEKHATANQVFLAEFERNMVDTACEFAKTRPVYLVRPIPEMGIDVPTAMSRRLALGLDAEVSVSLDDYHARHAFAWAAQEVAQQKCGVKILDPLPYLCSGTRKGVLGVQLAGALRSNSRCYGSQKGRPLYFDDDHLSEYGNRLLIPMFTQVFADNGGKSRPDVLVHSLLVGPVK
jgi:peptidoglycan/LPS O-acetylase OafA/YrhL